MSDTRRPGGPTVDLSTDAGLARYFRTQVENGGFAQLLFNLNGDHLAEIGDLLHRAGATVAVRHYEQAIHACLDDEPAYQAFLASDFVSENPLKSTLQRISIDYFATKVPFDREAARWLARIGAGSGLVIGRRAAHSGSSTTIAYLGEVRDEWRTAATDVLEVTLPAAPPPRLPGGPLQASLHREGRGAGRLGARFTPVPDARALVLRVAVGQSESPLVYGAVGLTNAEARVVLDELASQDGSTAFRALGPGRLEVLWATSHPIDGSSSGFQRLAGLLVPLLTLPVDATENDVSTAWGDHLESGRLSRALKWLRTALAKHPERGVFRSGASAAELDRLEASLGVALPAAVRLVLEEVNGGSFVDDRAPLQEDDSDARVACDLLGVAEIETAAFDLIAVNDASTAVERWDGKRPVHPRLRRLDGSLVPWPYLPIARTTKGGDLIVLELTNGGRVLDARHEVGPSAWGMVCARYVDFVETFLFQGGCIDPIGRASRDDGPTANTP